MGSSKMTFAFGEVISCAVFSLCYLRWCQQPRSTVVVSQVIPIQESVPSCTIESHATLEKEKQEWNERVTLLQKEVDDAREHASSIDRENEDMRARLEEMEAQVQEGSLYRQLARKALYEVTSALHQVCEQQDQDRRMHAIEIRALLGKEEKKPAPLISANVPFASEVIPPTIGAFSATVLTLVHFCLRSCADGAHANDSWDRKRLLELVKGLSHLPIAVVSLEDEGLRYLSPSFSKGLPSQEGFKELLEANRIRLQQQPFFEPCPLVVQPLTIPYVAFRCAHQTCNDVVLITPEPTLQHPIPEG